MALKQNEERLCKLLAKKPRKKNTIQSCMQREPQKNGTFKIFDYAKKPGEKTINLF